MKFLQAVTALLQCSLLVDAAATKERRQNNALKQWTFRPLPLGSVKPGGWLKNQMQLMADGLAGHEMDFYNVIKDSRWTGGATDYSDLNEGLPYWFNGLVPLAYGLNNAALISQVNKVADYVLSHQRSDGWLGPETQYNSNSLWGRFPLLLGLTQLAEANPSYTDKVVTALKKFVPVMDRLLGDGQSNNELWGRARYADATRMLQWLYEKYPGDNPSSLISTMQKLDTWGLDWAGFYTQGRYPFADLNTIPAGSQPFYGYVHAVNVAQGLKSMAVDWRWSTDNSLADRQKQAVTWALQYHGSPSGSILGDERMAGVGPHSGSETCTTVELMQTLTHIYQIMGERDFVEKAELAAYNALPAAMSPNHWQHNYLSLPNQPFAQRIAQPNGLFYNTGRDSVIFAVQPNYPCCAVNHPQGWAKLASSTFSRAENNGGIAHTVLAPGSVSYTIANNNAVSITCDTAYPFSPRLTYTINANSAFTFYVRVPAWQTTAPSMVLNGQNVANTSPDEHGVAILQIPAGRSTLIYTLNPQIVVENRANNTVAIHHGALLYAIDIGQTWTHEPSDVNGAPADAVTLLYKNVDPWNLAIDISTLRYDGPGPNDNPNIPNVAWEYQSPPNKITAQACEINWPLFQGIPARVPLRGSRKCTGARKTITLRPYGSLRARMVELPTIET